MSARLMTAAAAVLALTTMAQAEGCPPAGGATLGRIEQLNQMVVDQDFIEYAKLIEQDTGVNIRGGIMKVAEQFEAGFTGCTTIVQRSDIGGLTQTVVMYHGKIGPLFGYYSAGTVEGVFRILSFSVNSSHDEIMAKLH